VTATGHHVPSNFRLPSDHRLHTIARRGLLLGIVAAALCAVGFLVDAQQFYRSYLVAYLFWLGIALGSMGILMLQYITSGAWGAVARRVLEAAMRTLPLLVILFIPLLFGLHDLYVWTHSDVVARDELLQAKTFYLNVPFFLVRAAIYFVVWLVIARFLNRWAVEPDGGFDPGNEGRLRYLARGGLVLYALTMTFASIDWMMSIEPHWFSTIYGIMVIGGQVLTAFAFAIVMLAAVADRKPVSAIVGAQQFHDLGKLMLAFIMLWAYFAFSQYLIIWSGNLPEETPWYLTRTTGGWLWVGIALIVMHFAVPFVVLFSRDLKRNPALLAVVAALLLVMRVVDLFWLVSPAYSPAGFSLHWLDVATLVATGGLWIAFFVRRLDERPLLPIGEPSLPEPEEAL
jgi:hypothetical protein